jgi:predicted nucleic acid-binding protein
MNVIVDTSVWSLFLRRKTRDIEEESVGKLVGLLKNDTIYLIGVILEEILDGIRSEKQMDTLIKYFRPFPLIGCIREDFTRAAKYKNLCRKHGMNAGTIDFLIAAVCVNHHMPLLTADHDFEHISRYCPVRLL